MSKKIVIWIYEQHAFRITTNWTSTCLCSGTQYIPIPKNIDSYQQQGNQREISHFKHPKRSGHCQLGGGSLDLYHYNVQTPWHSRDMHQLYPGSGHRPLGIGCAPQQNLFQGVARVGVAHPGATFQEDLARGVHPGSRILVEEQNTGYLVAVKHS